MKFLRYFGLILLVLSCNSDQINSVEKALKSDKTKIKQVVDHLEAHEVQILFSEVIETDGDISFKDYSFHVNDSNYFYPASSVKFPVALLALEKLDKNKLLSTDTKFKVEGDSLITTFRDEINKLFAVSDNLAYTRLFEFLGQDYINSELNKRGLKSRISHRFSVPDPYALRTKSLHFYDNDSIVFSSNSILNDPLVHLDLNNIKKGEGYMENDSLINEPLDFSLKNYLPLTSLHNMMKQLIFPNAFEKNKRFNLSKTNREFLLKSMGTLPYELGYDRSEYYDSYVKFFLFGDSKDPIPEDIKIYNKVGYAYGYLTDCAYIVNLKTDKKYIISATIHVNKNQIFNDDVYEYETIGIPFLAEIGRELTQSH